MNHSYSKYSIYLCIDSGYNPNIQKEDYMKIFITLSAVLGTFLSLNAFSAERVLLSDSKITNVELNAETVRCSAKGYGLAELKVSIKGLDGWTLFNHSNIKAGDLAGQPCMTAGICNEFGAGNGLSIGDILNGGVRTEKIKVNRQIIEIKNIGKDENGADVCFRNIEERLQTTISRGTSNGVIKFSHQRSGLLETFPLSVCQ